MRKNTKNRKDNYMNHYNNLEFRKIIKLQSIDPELALEEFEKYLEKYPKDYYAEYMYIAHLITMQEFIKAEDLLNTLDKKVKKGSNINDSKRRTLESGIGIHCRIKLLLYTKRYLKLYEFMRENKDRYNEKTVHATYLYARKKLDLPIDEEDANKTYLTRQINNYSEEELLNCIDKHFTNGTGPEKNEAIFGSDIDIKELLREVRSNLCSDNRYCTGLLEDTYYFKLDYCGRNEDGCCDYFTVKCFTDTDKIITIYPTKNGTNFKYEDLNFIRENKIPKQKQLSRIDKFNQRYNRK